MAGSFTIDRPGLNAVVNSILNSPETHSCLKDALRVFLSKDPLDAWADAATLERILKARMDLSIGKEAQI
jgi:hypothetical protein